MPKVQKRLSRQTVDGQRSKPDGMAITKIVKFKDTGEEYGLKSGSEVIYLQQETMKLKLGG